MVGDEGEKRTIERVNEGGLRPPLPHLLFLSLAFFFRSFQTTKSLKQARPIQLVEDLSSDFEHNNDMNYKIMLKIKLKGHQSNLIHTILKNMFGVQNKNT